MSTLTVGPVGSGADRTVIQDAIEDVAATATPSNRGTVIIWPGFYPQRVDDNGSYVDVVADVPGTAVIAAPDTSTGGTYRIGIDIENATVHKLISGLRIIRNSSGVESVPPEAALYVGQEGGGGFPEELYWDDIIIKNCIIEGVHDGIQCFGQGTPAGAPPPVGLVLIRDCIIKCCHDALTMKGNMRMISKNNSIRVDNRGIAPYLTDIAPWKCTGFHMNTRDGQGPTGNPNSFFLSSHDSIWVIAAGNMGGEELEDQRHVAGYLFYDLRTAYPGQSAQTIHHTEIVDPHVVVDYLTGSGQVPDEVGGIVVVTTKLEIPKDRLIVAGGSILVRQLDDEAAVPAYGVLVDDALTSPPARTVRALGTRIKVLNLKTGQPCTSLATANDDDNIEADVYSAETIDEGDGSIVTAEHQP